MSYDIYGDMFFEDEEEVRQNDEIVIWVNTLAKYNKLMQYLESKNYSWANGDLATEHGIWKIERENTCICLEPDKELTYCDKAWFIKENYNILSFEEFMDMCNPEKTKQVNLNRELLKAMGIK